MPTVMWGGWIKKPDKITPHKESLQWPTLMCIWHPFDGANCREKRLSYRDLSWILSFLQKHLINCLPIAATSSGVVSEITLRAYVYTQSTGIGWSWTPAFSATKILHPRLWSHWLTCLLSFSNISEAGVGNKTEEKLEEFPGGPVVTTLKLPMQGVQVWSLVREVRSHMPECPKI